MSVDNNGREIPLSWFTRSLWKYTPLYIELIFLAICLRLIGLVDPFIFQVIIDRILPFQREASLIVVVAIFAAVSLFQMGFEVLSSLLGILTANKVTREFGSRIRLSPECQWGLIPMLGNAGRPYQVGSARGLRLRDLS